MPGAPLPLHIFEERYKQMVDECLQQESEFGMVFADESGTRKVGCTAKIVELVERYDDGRMLILVEGSRRFRLNNVLTGKPYYVGEIEFFEEEPEEPDVQTLAEECIALLERVVEAATEGSVGIEIEPPYRNLSFAIAGRVGVGAGTRPATLGAAPADGARAAAGAAPQQRAAPQAPPRRRRRPRRVRGRNPPADPGADLGEGASREGE